MYRGIAGVVSETSKREHVKFEWKLNNFSSLSEEVNDHYTSPDFSISGRSFFLKIFPNGARANNTQSFINLYLVLRKSCPAINVKWTLAIKRADGEIKKLANYINSFSSEGNRYGVTLKIRRTELLGTLNSLTIISTFETSFPHPLELSETPIAGRVREGHCTQLFKEIFWDINIPIARLDEKKELLFMSPLHTFGTQECQLSLSVYHEIIIVNMNISNISNSRYLMWSAGILRADGTEYWTGKGQALLPEEIDLIPFGTWCGPPKNELIQQMTQALTSGGVSLGSVLTFFLKISMQKVEEHATDISMMKADKPTITEEKSGERQPLELTVLTNLSTSLKDLYVTGKHSDVTFKVGKKKFEAHKLILGARTPVLEAMFSHNMTESETGVVCIEDCHPEAFEVFLLFVYSGVAKNLTNENVTDVFYTADKYDLPPLKEVCVHHMLSNLTVDSICTTLALAFRHGEEVLLQKATEYFVKNAREVYRTAAWPKFMIENVSLANELIIRSHENVK